MRALFVGMRALFVNSVSDVNAMNSKSPCRYLSLLRGAVNRPLGTWHARQRKPAPRARAQTAAAASPTHEAATVRSAAPRVASLCLQPLALSRVPRTSLGSKSLMAPAAKRTRRTQAAAALAGVPELYPRPGTPEEPDPMDEVPPLDGQDPPRPHGAAAQQEERAEPASAEISEVFKYFLMSCKSATRRTHNLGAVLDRDVVEHFRAGPRRRAPAQRGAAHRGLRHPLPRAPRLEGAHDG